jgi:hypothetical protein
VSTARAFAFQIDAVPFSKAAQVAYRLAYAANLRQRRTDIHWTRGCVRGAVMARRGRAMLYTIAVVLLVMWLLGLVSGYTIGAFIHVLLVVAIVLFLVGLISGRRVA